MIVVLTFSILATALVVYAICRYGAIPAIRNARNDTASTEAWREGGWSYRISLLGIALAVALAVAAGVMLVEGLLWQAGVGLVAAVAIVPFANYHRFKILRRYRSR